MPRPPPPAAAFSISGNPSDGELARVPLERDGRPRHDRDPGRLGTAARRQLVAERLQRRGRRSDEDEPGGLDRAGEAGILGQEAVAGVDRL